MSELFQDKKQNKNDMQSVHSKHSIQKNFFLLFHSYSRQETSMLSPEGLPMPNSVVYCKNKQGEKKKVLR